MTSNVKENEFKGKAPELFKELKERVRHLKETGAIVNEILKIIDESESLLNSNPEESEKKYDEAQSKIETIEISHRAKPLAWRLLWIELSYLVLLLLLGYFTYKWPHFVLWDGLMDDPIAMHLQTVWFGALGGVTIAIYGIYEHIQLRDFDPKYELWYICKPLIGGIFGWFVYLIYFIGLVSVQGIDIKIKTPELPYVIAFLAGFSERFTLKMIDKLMGILTTWQEKPSGGGSQKETTK
jgi:RsiW-degrading membrane proteinase PrsW (M82 family)